MMSPATTMTNEYSTNSTGYLKEQQPTDLADAVVPSAVVDPTEPVGVLLLLLLLHTIILAILLLRSILM
jgi:hypothetical protein